MVDACGTAKSHGHLTTKPKSPIVGITAAQADVATGSWPADGAVYHFGSVKSYSSPRTVARQGGRDRGGRGLSETGYWITTSEGKVYRFGSAKFYGDERRPRPTRS
ncbi:MAG TPA: hypothetical protein VKU92_13395 [Acidimicrobiales bacterium]|nr:hypothetical protein [Acidimicrobiales bacterium]